MTALDATVAKLQELPEPLIEEVSDYIDFLALKHDRDRWQLVKHLIESQEAIETDFADYFPNLVDYENRLARGEIQW